MGRSAFVTGAAGFVGRHLVERLDHDGWTVTAYCRRTDPVHLLPAPVVIEFGDLAEQHRLTDAMPDQVDAVFHLAGNTSTWSRDRVAQRRDNVDGTAHVIDAALARRGCRLVYTSSTSAYGHQPGVRLTESSPSNAATRGDNYGRSKLAAEQLVKSACANRGLDAVILNPVNILGAYDVSNWSRQLIVPISDARLRVVPPGSATWISVHDVVDAHVAAVDAGAAGSNIILGGVEASFLAVVNEIERILGQPLSVRKTPRPVLRVLLALSTAMAALTRTEPEFTSAKYRRAVGDLLVDDALARTILGLRRTSLSEQLEQTVDWLRSERILVDPSPQAGDDPCADQPARR